MHTLKLIGRNLIRLCKQIGSIPAAIRRAVKERRRQTELQALEVERLDRIRNPLKYRGK